MENFAQSNGNQAKKPLGKADSQSDSLFLLLFMDSKLVYDHVIIGAGCAGASGAMYAARMNLKTVMIAELPGGLITTTHIVENWPGIISISGPDLATNLLQHAQAFGVELKNERVIEIAKTIANPAVGKQTSYTVKTASNTYYAKTVLIATGTKHKTMDVPGEKEFTNKGLSYCALCDGAFFKGKTVAIVGSGDSAAKEALLMSEYCPKVYIFVRGKILKAEPVNFDRVQKNSKIEVIYGDTVAEVMGTKSVEKVKMVSGREIELQGLFVAIGHNALSELAEKLGVTLNDKKEIMINRQSETNLPGIFAAGDVCDTRFKQAITGSAEAVTAAFYASEYLGKNEVVLE